MKPYNEKGKCSCGDVEFELHRVPMFIHCCHCSWCQRETGSAFALNAMVETSNVKITKGSVLEIQNPSNSGKGQTIVRCRSCCTALWSYYGGAGDKVAFVRVGTLQNAANFSPDIHIFTSTKHQWLQLSDEIPVVEEYYRRSSYWPEESVLRYKKALGVLQ